MTILGIRIRPFASSKSPWFQNEGKKVCDLTLGFYGPLKLQYYKLVEIFAKFFLYVFRL